jgi:hypothetical protein
MRQVIEREVLIGARGRSQRVARPAVKLLVDDLSCVIGFNLVCHGGVLSRRGSSSGDRGRPPSPQTVAAAFWLSFFPVAGPRPAMS